MLKRVVSRCNRVLVVCFVFFLSGCEILYIHAGADCTHPHQGFIIVFGRVTDDSGAGVPAANVVIETSQGGPSDTGGECAGVETLKWPTVTDLGGYFREKIEVGPGNLVCAIARAEANDRAGTSATAKLEPGVEPGSCSHDGFLHAAKLEIVIGN